MQYRQANKIAVERLRESGIADAVYDSRILLEFVCKTDGSYLLAHPERELSEEEETEFYLLLEKRADHIPVQYITGKQEFMGLEFVVSDACLIPRQDTEILVEEVMRHLQDGMSLLDMCTGSGCILLSLLHYSNDCIGTGADISKDALDIAKENAQKLCLEAEFIESDLFDQIRGKYDLIVSNPPYIQSDVIMTLDSEVKDHEPILALDGDTDGLSFYRRITKDAKKHLVRGGMLFYEIGYDEKNEVMSIMQDEGFHDITCVKDLSGNDRVVYGTFIE